MRTVVITALATACLALAAGRAAAQGAGSVSVGFRSEVKTPIVLQGYSTINGMQRRGQPLSLNFGKIAVESTVPPGIRYYTVYDLNQPTRVLLRDFPVPVQGDGFFLIRSAPNNPLRVLLVPAMP